MTSLLGLVGIAADPLSSREHVLLSNLVENAWRAGKSLDLGALIGQIQAPPLRKLGVFEIDAFFPPKERTELALKLNALVASPSFAAWGAGQALDPATLLRTPDGKPRCAIVYLAYLFDPERQFVVTLLLSKLVTWMRGQPGTFDLRTLAYMDEIFGFVPPTAMPPAKKPILTILKALLGVGMVLDAEPGRPRLQGHGQRRHVARRPAPDRARQGPRPRGLTFGGGSRRRRARRRDRRPAEAAVPAREREELGARALRNAGLCPTSAALGRNDQIETLTKDAPRPEPVPEPVVAPTPSAVPAACGRREHRRRPAWRTASPSASSTRPHRGADEVGASSDGGRLHASSRRASRSASTTRRPTSTTPRSGRRCTACSTRDSTSTARRRLTTTTGDFRAEAPANGGYVLPVVPVGEAKFFRDATSQIQRRLSDNRTSTCATVVRFHSRPGETPDQTEADRETAKLRDRLEAKRDRLEDALETARRRVEELDSSVQSHRTTELIAGAGRSSARLGGKRSTRSIAGSVGSAVTPRRHGPRNASEPRRRRRNRRPTSPPTSSRNCSTRWRRSTRAGRSSRRTSRRSRSGRGGRHQSESAHAALGADRPSPCLPGPARRSAARLPSDLPGRRPLVHRKRKLADSSSAMSSADLPVCWASSSISSCPKPCLISSGVICSLCPVPIHDSTFAETRRPGTCRRARSGRRRTSPSASRGRHGGSFPRGDAEAGLNAAGPNHPPQPGILAPGPVAQ